MFPNLDIETLAATPVKLALALPQVSSALPDNILEKLKTGDYNRLSDIPSEMWLEAIVSKLSESGNESEQQNPQAVTCRCKNCGFINHYE